MHEICLYAIPSKSFLQNFAQSGDYLAADSCRPPACAARVTGLQLCFGNLLVCSPASSGRPGWPGLSYSRIRGSRTGERVTTGLQQLSTIRRQKKKNKQRNKQSLCLVAKPRAPRRRTAAGVFLEARPVRDWCLPPHLMIMRTYHE